MSGRPDKSVKFAAGLAVLSAVPFYLAAVIVSVFLLVQPLSAIAGGGPWWFKAEDVQQRLVTYAVMLGGMGLCYFMSSLMLLFSKLLQNNLLSRPRRVNPKLIGCETLSIYLMFISCLMLAGALIGYFGVLVYGTALALEDVHYYLGTLIFVSITLFMINRYFITPIVKYENLPVEVKEKAESASAFSANK